ncbi:hypothetical protein SOM08_21570 [Hydrogenophaga sp. SNF1]|uniref:helix-turn-helix domain-containing transcriptional regulator n=1 Tax=Hydrogenophaga sp. SNF1 TaxID=3098762 RepID=UPI002ACBE261|nr:hypothetical protein [Hydrogenophaga sp. SNF1]WQB83556.1 hypothetical protein SOM08_21570 [Hydrogenophaga sp. SNF1]
MRKAEPANKRKTKTRPYDVVAYLSSPEDMAAYPYAWLAEAPDDAAGIARAKGVPQVAKDAGLSFVSAAPMAAALLHTTRLSPLPLNRARPEAPCHGRCAQPTPPPPPPHLQERLCPTHPTKTRPR